jgi:hypothetical protein
MTTFNWVVTALNCLPNAPEGQDYVINVHYSCIGTDGTYNASVYSTCSLPVVQETTFIPYQDLTLDIVLGWIWANGVDKAATESAVQTQLDNLINPPVVTPPLPWSQA